MLLIVNITELNCPEKRYKITLNYPNIAGVIASAEVYQITFRAGIESVSTKSTPSAPAAVDLGVCTSIEPSTKDAVMKQ